MAIMEFEMSSSFASIAVDVMAMADAPQTAEPTAVSQVVFRGRPKSLPRISAHPRRTMNEIKVLRYTAPESVRDLLILMVAEYSRTPMGMRTSFRSLA